MSSVSFLQDSAPFLSVYQENIVSYSCVASYPRKSCIRTATVSNLPCERWDEIPRTSTYLLDASNSIKPVHIHSCTNQFDPNVSSLLDDLISIIRKLRWIRCWIEFDISRDQLWCKSGLSICHPLETSARNSRSQYSHDWRQTQTEVPLRQRIPSCLRLWQCHQPKISLPKTPARSDASQPRVSIGEIARRWVDGYLVGRILTVSPLKGFHTNALYWIVNSAIPLPGIMRPLDTWVVSITQTM